jgi:ParB/RepB/Spo0J family partition protein
VDPQGGGEEVTALRLIPLERLIHPSHPIRLDPEEGLEELIESIRVQGILQPIIARPVGKELYEVVAGERRLKAAKRAGLLEVPVIVRRVTDEEVDLIRLTENLQREDLSDYEVALWLKRLRDRYGLSMRKLGTLLGKDHAWIVRHLNMLRVEEVVTCVTTESPVLRRSLKPRDVMRRLTEGHCRVLLQAPEEHQPMLAEKIALAVSQGLKPPSMKEIEKTWREAEEARRAIEERVKAEVEKAEEAAGFQPAPVLEVPERAEEPFEEAVTPGVTEAPLRGYWVCELCKGWMPGVALEPPEEMLLHLGEKHGWEPPQPGAWGEALLFSEYMPGQGRRLCEEPEFIDTGMVFTCPVCGWQATIIHRRDGSHRLQRIRVVD